MTRLTKVASHWDVSIKLATALRLKGAWPLLSKADQLHALAMTREEYTSAIEAILFHDKIISRVRDVSSDLAREVGDDFGGCAITPETGLRSAFIKLIESSCGDTCANTSYLVDEAWRMKDGGSITFPNGVCYPITNADDCWIAIQAEKGGTP